MPTLGIVGFGGWGANLLRTFDDLARVSVACHAGDPERAAWLAASYPHIDRTTSYGELLGNDDIEAVIIASPIDTLGDFARRALHAGKDVFVEKPMATTAEEAQGLTDLAAAEGRTLFVGYIFVHHPLFRRAWDRLRAAGIEHVRLEWAKLGGFDSDLVLNLACHPVSVALHYLGTPGEIELTSSRRLTGDTDVITVKLDYPDVTCRIRVDRVSPRKQYEWRLYTGDGRCAVATDDSFHIFDRSDETFREESTVSVDPLTTECRQFLRTITTGHSPRTDGEFGTAVVTVLERLQEQLEG